MATIRLMTVAYATDGSLNKPMIRIANWFLQKSGFSVKDKIIVEYQNGAVIIRKSFTTHEQSKLARSTDIRVHSA